MIAGQVAKVIVVGAVPVHVAKMWSRPIITTIRVVMGFDLHNYRGVYE